LRPIVIEKLRIPFGELLELLNSISLIAASKAAAVDDGPLS
jgi:hypothetical protein